MDRESIGIIPMAASRVDSVVWQVSTSELPDRLLSVRNAVAEAYKICWQVSSRWHAIFVPVQETTCAIGRLQRGSRLLLDKGGWSLSPQPGQIFGRFRRWGPKALEETTNCRPGGGSSMWPWTCGRSCKSWTEETYHSTGRLTWRRCCWFVLLPLLCRQRCIGCFWTGCKASLVGALGVLFVVVLICKWFSCAPMGIGCTTMGRQCIYFVIWWFFVNNSFHRSGCRYYLLGTFCIVGGDTACYPQARRCQSWC